jgi:hypothetical protein
MTIRLIAVAFLLLGSAPGAVADETHPLSGDDLSAPDWSGLYVGVHGGYGRSSADWRFPFFQYYNLAPGEGLSADPKGALAGGHLLFNYQFGRFVAGIEGAPARRSATGALAASCPTTPRTASRHASTVSRPFPAASALPSMIGCSMRKAATPPPKSGSMR